jgi:sn-glycerol 3-phosphate transport system permease protein
MRNDQVTYDTPTGARAVGRYGALIVISVLVLFPVYTTVIAALKPGNKVLVNPLVPDAFTLDIFRAAWSEGHLGRFMLNSLVVAVIVTVAQVVTSVLSAYAFSILEWPGRNVVFVAFLATLLVPLEATLVVNRRTVDSLDWLNTYQGLTVPFLATAFGTFLIRQVFLTLPRDLRDAAAIDGVGHLGFMRHVAVPLVRPTIGAMAALAFLSTWNQYLWPNLVTTESDMYTLQSGLRALSQSSGVDRPNLVMAGVIIAFLPILVVLLGFQRQLVRGLTSGGVKG